MWDGTLLLYSNAISSFISIHPSRVGWDKNAGGGLPALQGISIHPSRVGWDPSGGRSENRSRHFNPPIPCGMGPFLSTISRGFLQKFQSTHPVWDGTAESGRIIFCSGISIHPSRVGWDLCFFTPMLSAPLFQSTHPVWDGTEDCLDDAAAELFQSTHPVWDGTSSTSSKRQERRISIHPSRVGWDFSSFQNVTRVSDFNPPIPCGMGRDASG